MLAGGSVVKMGTAMPAARSKSMTGGAFVRIHKALRYERAMSLHEPRGEYWVLLLMTMCFTINSDDGLRCVSVARRYSHLCSTDMHQLPFWAYLSPDYYRVPALNLLRCRAVRAVGRVCVGRRPKINSAGGLPDQAAQGSLHCPESNPRACSVCGGVNKMFCFTSVDAMPGC